MKIITGLRPRAELQRLPEHSESIHAYRDGVTAVIPTPNLKVREVWILTFQKVGYYSDGERWMGDVMETMLTASEPKIEKKSIRYSLADETPRKADAEGRYRSQYNVPDDARRQSRRYENARHTDVTLNWYEVTL